jgi:hypothetical protein
MNSSRFTHRSIFSIEFAPFSTNFSPYVSVKSTYSIAFFLKKKRLQNVVGTWLNWCKTNKQFIIFRSLIFLLLHVYVYIIKSNGMRGKRRRDKIDCPTSQCAKSNNRKNPFYIIFFFSFVRFVSCWSLNIKLKNHILCDCNKNGKLVTSAQGGLTLSPAVASKSGPSPMDRPNLGEWISI